MTKHGHQTCPTNINLCMHLDATYLHTWMQQAQQIDSIDISNLIWSYCLFHVLLFCGCHVRWWRWIGCQGESFLSRIFEGHKGCCRPQKASRHGGGAAATSEFLTFDVVEISPIGSQKKVKHVDAALQASMSDDMETLSWRGRCWRNISRCIAVQRKSWDSFGTPPAAIWQLCTFNTSWVHGELFVASGLPQCAKSAWDACHRIKKLRFVGILELGNQKYIFGKKSVRTKSWRGWAVGLPFSRRVAYRQFTNWCISSSSFNHGARSKPVSPGLVPKLQPLQPLQLHTFWLRFAALRFCYARTSVFWQLGYLTLHL